MPKIAYGGGDLCFSAVDGVGAVSCLPCPTMETFYLAMIL